MAAVAVWPTFGGAADALAAGGASFITTYEWRRHGERAPRRGAGAKPRLGLAARTARPGHRPGCRGRHRPRGLGAGGPARSAVGPRRRAPASARGGRGGLLQHGARARARLVR